MLFVTEGSQSPSTQTLQLLANPAGNPRLQWKAGLRRDGPDQVRVGEPDNALDTAGRCFRLLHAEPSLPPDMKRNTCIEISLAEIAPDLLVSMGEREYLLWAKELSDDIRARLSTLDDTELKVEIKSEPLRAASTKSGILAIGTIGIAFAGYLGAPEKATKLLTAIWGALKKAFQKNAKGTSIDVSLETTPRSTKEHFKITGDDAQAVLAMYRAVKSQEPGQARLKVTPRKK